VIEPLSIYLGCTDTLTTPVVLERGRLVGVGSGPPCYGEGKRYMAEEWARVHQVRMADAVAYADNWSDRALLAEVGRAVVVHPRGRLLRLARARGWDIVRPRRPRRPKRDSQKSLTRDGERNA
jgi:phosphoserine phosphatase